MFYSLTSRKLSIECLIIVFYINYNITESTVQFIIGLPIFLSDRCQQVILDNCHSDPFKVSSGVPQGSVLRILLFLLYINDLPRNITSTIRLYADDTVVYRIIHLTDDIQNYKRIWTYYISGLKIGLCYLIYRNVNTSPSQINNCL